MKEKFLTIWEGCPFFRYTFMVFAVGAAVLLFYPTRQQPYLRRGATVANMAMPQFAVPPRQSLFGHWFSKTWDYMFVP